MNTSREALAVGIVSIATLLSATASAGEQPSLMGPSGLVTTCHPIWLPRYTPRKIETLDDLPPQVKDNFLRRLTDSLGPSVVTALIPAGGQAIDSADYFKANPTSDLPRFRYEMMFSILLDEDGPVRYCVKALFDPAGEIVEGPELPKCGQHPGRCKVVGLGRVREVAQALGVPAAESKVDLWFNRSKDVLEYVVTYPAVSSEGKPQTIALHIRADDPTQVTWNEVKIYS